MTRRLTGRCVLVRTYRRLRWRTHSSPVSPRVDWTGDLRWGALLSSLNLPAHTWSTDGGSRFWCSVCGSHDGKKGPEDLNILNFERFKWGGIRHTNPLYIGFDLEQFSRQGPVVPTGADLAMMRQVLEAARSLPARATVRLGKSALSNCPLKSRRTSHTGWNTGLLRYFPKLR